MKKRLLSALLTMCMMLTMLPVAAMAADEENQPESLWTQKDGVNVYALTDDTTIQTIEATEGQYKVDLDTKTLTVGEVKVATGSSLELTADTAKGGNVKAADADKGITFKVGGSLTTTEYVTFKDTVYVLAGDTDVALLSDADATTISGKFENGLHVNTNAVLKDVEVLKGDITIAADANVTVAGKVTVADGEIKVAGNLTYGKNAEVVGEVTPTGTGKINVDSAVTAYTLTVGKNGYVDVYATNKDTDTTAIATVTDGTSVVTVARNATSKLSFVPNSGYSANVTVAKGNEAKKSVTLTNNTYELTNDTEKYAVDVDFTSNHSSGGSGGGASGYSVNVASTTNGTVTVSPKNAAKDSTVTVTVKPNEGYVLDTLTVTDKDGKTITLTDKGDGKYTFTMPASAVTVKATFKVVPKTPFTDVASNAWYADAVAYVYEKGMMNGTSATKFGPEETTTRGMIVTILYRLENEPTATASSFTDVAAGKYYSKAVAWASANKIVTGYGDGKFGPDDIITREQMAAILYRYASYKGYDVSKSSSLTSFTDASQVGVFARTAMQWSIAEGLINGTSTTVLSPKSGATRAQVATILMRFCENIAK